MKFLIIEKMPVPLKIFLMENPTLTFAHLPWILLVMAYSIFPDCPASILCLFYGEVCIRIGERGPGRRLIQYISVAKSKQSWLDLYAMEMQSGLVWFEERPAGLWNGGKYPGERGGLRVLGGWGRFYGKSTYLKRGYTEENMNTGQKKYSSSFFWAGNTLVSFTNPLAAGSVTSQVRRGTCLGTHQWNATLCILTRLHSDVTFGQESLICVKILPFRVPVKFFSFWWSGTLKTICWTPPVNIDGNITGVEKRKHFAVGVKQTNNKSIWVSSPTFICFFYRFCLLISNDHNFQWILQILTLACE